MVLDTVHFSIGTKSFFSSIAFSSFRKKIVEGPLSNSRGTAKLPTQELVPLAGAGELLLLGLDV